MKLNKETDEMKLIKKKNVIFIFFVTISVIGGFHFLQEMKSQEHRIRMSRVCMTEALRQIIFFEKMEGRYPNSLNELSKYVESHPEEGFQKIVLKEYISDSKGNEKEYDILNGEGGWFYNRKTGLLTINLIKPVKSYMSCYSGSKKKEIPADWGKEFFEVFIFLDDFNNGENRE